MLSRFVLGPYTLSLGFGLVSRSAKVGFYVCSNLFRVLANTLRIAYPSPPLPYVICSNPLQSMRVDS